MIKKASYLLTYSLAILEGSRVATQINQVKQIKLLSFKDEAVWKRNGSGDLDGEIL